MNGFRLPIDYQREDIQRFISGIVDSVSGSARSEGYVTGFYCRNGSVVVVFGFACDDIIDFGITFMHMEAYWYGLAQTSQDIGKSKTREIHKKEYCFKLKKGRRKKRRPCFQLRFRTQPMRKSCMMLLIELTKAANPNSEKPVVL